MYEILDKDYKILRVYTLDDIGNAERFISKYPSRVMYSFAANSWYIYDEKHWVKDEKGLIYRMANIVIDEIPDEKELHVRFMHKTLGTKIDVLEKQYDRFAKSCRSHKSKTDMLKEARSMRSIAPHEFDADNEILNVNNGVVHLETGELLPHNPFKYITKLIPHNYNQDAPAPLWKNFLNEVFDNNHELIRFVQKAAGYSATGHTNEDCIFFCYGTGRNGKSVFLNTIRDILSGYVVNIQPETIMQKNQGSGGTSDIARLKGARMVTASEPDAGARLKESLIKQMTGGEKLTAARKYEHEFEFLPEFKLWLLANEKPKITGTDAGIWSRIMLIPFTVFIKEEDRDKDLRRKLLTEAEGILKWLIDGALAWRKEGLRPPAVVTEAKEEYRTEMDVLGAFVEECCEIGAFEVRSSDLYSAYKEWARANNEYVMTATKFGREMGKRFEKRRISEKTYYCGLRISPDNNPRFILQED